MSGLATSLAEKASDSAFQEANTQRVQADARLETLIADGLALKHPLITQQSPLSQSLVSGLTQALANQANASNLLPNVGPATFTGNLTVTDAFYAGSLETGHGLLTPKVIAPSNADLALRN